jgi:adenosylmethionine-8-amino-7-oxononanoate aminotransferase
MTSAIWHPFTQHGLGEPIPRIVRTEGAMLHTDDGRRIVDAISSWWVTTHGHRNPRIMAAIARATEAMDQIIFAGFTHDAAEEVATGLVRLVPELPHVFFSDSGSTAVEVALKMALGFWTNTGRPRHRILVLEHSYHGDTIGAMSVGARGVYNRAYQPLLFDVGTLPYPVSGREQETLDALEAFARAPDPPAALIVEPLLLGAGGMLVYSAAVLAGMREICARNDILFIADEVMTGWGRTGTLFACEQAGIVPDILCLSKGLTGGAVPLAVTMAKPAIFEAHRSADRGAMFFHSSSYTANPIACAAAAANLAIWRDEPVVERVAGLARQQGRFVERIARCPSVRNARSLGTICAFDFDDPRPGYLSAMGPRLMAHFLERDILIRPLGNTIYLMPPYCIEEAELARVHDAVMAVAESPDAI